MSAEQIINVTCTALKNEAVYTLELKEKNVKSEVYIRGIQGPKGESGDAQVTEASKQDIENLFN